jgi:hypothetical protein
LRPGWRIRPGPTFCSDHGHLATTHGGSNSSADNPVERRFTQLQAVALSAVAVALGRTEQLQQAEQVARSITKPDLQALTAVVVAVVQAGQHEQAQHVARQTEQLARSITHPDRQTRALKAMAGALTGAGDKPSVCRVLAALYVVGRRMG